MRDETMLRDLARENAPPDFVATVLMRVGLRDGFFTFGSPAGKLYAAFNPRGISAIMHARDALAFQAAFRARFGRDAYATDDVPAQIRKAVAGGMRGRRAEKVFDLRGLSEFERAVLGKALEIPYGQTRSYAWIAREVGRPGAVRAAGSALAKNPVPLLIPCHRVTRSDGSLGEYALGPENKIRLLRAEGFAVEEALRMARSGTRFLGSRSTGIFCYPSCANARRISERHRIGFRSEAAATAAGFRPCKQCRPGVAS